MREIKFHILKIDLHSFLYNEGRTILEIGIEDLVAIRHNPKNYLFIQYTGLKDKNGKEIYKGDVIKESFGKMFEVVFWEGCFCYKKDEKHGQIFNPKDVEVIGNIYENPELSKEL